MVGSYPEVAVLVELDAGNTVVGQTVVHAVTLGLMLFQVVADDAVVGADVQLAAKLTGNAGWCAVVQAVLATKCAQPVLRLDVHGADTHRGGRIDAPSVGRQRHLRDEVVGDAVHLAVVGSIVSHRVALHVARLDVQSQQSQSHGAYPEPSAAVDLHVEDTLRGASRQRVGMVGQRLGVNPSQSLLVGAYPHASLVVFAQAEDGSREVVAEMLDGFPVGGETVQSVLVGANPYVAVAALPDAGHAGHADGVTRT